MLDGRDISKIKLEQNLNIYFIVQQLVGHLYFQQVSSVTEKGAHSIYKSECSYVI